MLHHEKSKNSIQPLLHHIHSNANSQSNPKTKPEKKIYNKKKKEIFCEMDLIGVLELVVHEASDDTGFADGLVS